jgi:hypothetical protein
MLFHVEFIPRENWGPADAAAIQPMAIATINTIINSASVKTSGFYADERGGFFVIDIDSPDTLLRLIAPILDIVSFTSHPIVGGETMQQLMQELTK